MYNLETAYYEDFIKFAKKHYGDWNNQEEMIKKLKIVNAYWSGTDVECIFNIDLVRNLHNILKKHLNYEQYHQSIKKVIRRKYNSVLSFRRVETIEDEIEFLLTEIIFLEVKNDNEVLINLGKNKHDLEMRLNN